MSIHFFSVLGTSLYEPVVYQFIEEKELKKEQEFVQIAMLEELQEQLKENGKVSIFLTDGAKKRNWEDRQYNENDKGISDRWVSEKKQEIQVNEKKRGMKTILQSQYPELYEKTKGIDICNAGTEDEIWSVFETLYNTIEEGDEIIFDITHSFRSIPMLAITVINYAKVMKDCTLRGIYYGAYEAAEVKEGVKYAPIVDLTVYNEILDWTNAAEAFMQYGVAAKMQRVYEEKKKTVSVDKIKEWKPIGKKIKAMQELSMAIYTCRGADAANLSQKQGNMPLKSIKNAYQRLKENSTKESEIRAKEIAPLHPLLKKIDENYKTYFDKDENLDIGIGVVEWSIQNGMVQQGYTALEETIITYLCRQYNIDDRTERTRERIIGRTVTGIGKYIQMHSENAFIANREAVWQIVSADCDENKEVVREVIHSIPISILRLSDKVKKKRNDINHFGFRDFPASSTDLAKDLKKLYEEFMEIIKDESKGEDIS